MPHPPRVLSIAGSDSGAGAGIQADLKTLGAWGCFGMTAITAVTAQNTCGVCAIEAVPPALIAQQIDAVVQDIGVDAVKIGLLPDAASVAVVADALQRHGLCRVVLDPVLVASSGDALAADGVATALMQRLLPRVALITPNLDEAARLSGLPVRDLGGMQAVAERLRALGAQAVLVKGGHLEGDRLTDLLLDDAGFTHWVGERIATPNTHGTGCTLSSAIAAGLAHGLPLAEAVAQAREYLRGALQAGARWRLGQGRGPLDHGWCNPGH